MSEIETKDKDVWVLSFPFIVLYSVTKCIGLKKKVKKKGSNLNEASPVTFYKFQVYNLPIRQNVSRFLWNISKNRTPEFGKQNWFRTVKMGRRQFRIMVESSMISSKGKSAFKYEFKKFNSNNTAIIF